MHDLEPGRYGHPSALECGPVHCGAVGYGSARLSALIECSQHMRRRNAQRIGEFQDDG